MSHPPGTSIHLIADLEGCSGLDDLPLIERALREAAAAAGVTVLETRLHHFGEGHGVTGFAVLAESHISIHTWPEAGVAAVDLFVCGQNADAQAGLNVLCNRMAGIIARVQAIERLSMLGIRSSTAA
ncbi:adenosylmethionine decarboxylase [Novosphingobium colocasiae]|uniref:Adenosylmethionine decarboxylase n=1 Tax=Novosphingobium colocasiae TaxID=1256513 RepID=A0A918PIJ8_9SPHN|nr:adenosylmethionine decarboxylase [Novosphingobium colocasiae]GGZ11508.1 hypothetical protein GCM10011614_28160 [Novosphingobium colocasiae]